MIKPVIAAVFLLSAGAAQAQQSCVQRQQLADMSIVILPDFMEAAAARCRPQLSPQAFLTSPAAGEMAGRLRAEIPTRRSSARAGFEVISRSPLPPGISDGTAISMMSEAMATQFAGGLGEQACRNADEMLRAMAPLPPENVGRLVASLLALSEVGGDGRSPPVCPA